MEIFLYNYCIILIVLCIYGLIGGFSIAPFSTNLRYPILVAPLMGMSLLPMGVFLLYSFGGLSVKWSSLIIFAICSSLTFFSLIHLKSSFNIKNIFSIGFFVLAFSALVTYLVTSTSIEVGSLGFLFREGSDHLGYACMADWLKDHLINEAPSVNSSNPYQSFPAFLVGNDHEILGSDPLSANQRFGSFFTLAIIASLIGQSSTFSYDITCAIILISSYLGISALYSSTRNMLILLSFSLLIGFWFILSRTGYLGKIMGFPTIPLILGMYFLQHKNNSLINENKISWVMILLLTFAAAMVYPGEVLATFLLAIGGLFLVFKTIDVLSNAQSNEVINLFNNAGLLIIMVLIALSAQGLLSLPRSLHSVGNLPLGWMTVLLNQFDIRYLAHDNVFNWYSDFISIIFFAFSITICLFGMLITLFRKDIVASSLLGSALCLLVIPYILKSKWLAYELSGTIYPLTLCGFAWFIGNLSQTLSIKKSLSYYLFIFFMLATIIIRTPSFVESVHKYTNGSIPSSMQYSKKEMNQLKHAIGDRPVIVDIPHVMFALPILVELGREKINLQWTPESWKAVLGYRKWEPKKMLPSNLILALNSNALTLIGLSSMKNNNCKVINTTRQYQLFECDNILTSANFLHTYSPYSV